MTSQRIDVVSAFPDYLTPLGLSLLGRAREDGLISLYVHDLRAFTLDRHRTIDDTPYGGGAGMVMRPEPWGEALDAIIADSDMAGVTPTLVVPTPSGALFSQQVALQLAQLPWLVFACGRYEGIDQRVSEHYAARIPVRELSLGDYVLSGGEAAALVMIEAVTRLIPGFVGNPRSVVEESHGAGELTGLLEYPVYTKPASWRGHDVPPVLLSGNHGRIAQWRLAESVRRTAERRPDLAHGSRTLGVGGPDDHGELRLATPADAAELLVLQRCCSVSEAHLNDALELSALTETLDDVTASLDDWLTLVVRAAGRLVASVRGRLHREDGDREPVWRIGRLMVVPDLAGRGLDSWLLSRMEAAAPAEAASYQLRAGARSEQELRMYSRAGYRRARSTRDEAPVVILVKPARGRTIRKEATSRSLRRPDR